MVTQKYVDLPNGGLYWKSLFRRTYAFLLDIKWNLWEKAFSSAKKKNQPKFCGKTCWKEQPTTVYLMNHIFQTSVLLIVMMECIIELN